MSPTNKWSDTYASTNSQQSRYLSSTTPITEPEIDLSPFAAPFSRSEGFSPELLASGVRKLAVGHDKQIADRDLSGTKPSESEQQAPDMLKAMESLARKYLEQGRYDRAEATGEDVVHLHRETFGNKHPRLIAALSNLAVSYREQGKLDKTKAAHAEIFFLQREAFPDSIVPAVQCLEYISGLEYKHERGIWERALDRPNVLVKGTALHDSTCFIASLLLLMFRSSM